MFDLLDEVPGFDGLHLLDQYKGERLIASFMFLRHDGEVTVADPAAFMVDDVRSTLDRHANRLLLA